MPVILRSESKTGLGLLLKVACADENGAVFFVVLVFYKPFRRFLYSGPMLGYGPHGILFRGSEFISQDIQGDPAKDAFFVGFRGNGRYFGHGIPALKPRK